MVGLFNFTPTSPFRLGSSKKREEHDFSLGEKSQRRRWGTGGLCRVMEMFHLVCECGSCLVLIVSSGIAANSSARAMGFPLQNIASSKRNLCRNFQWRKHLLPPPVATRPSARQIDPCSCEISGALLLSEVKP